MDEWDIIQEHIEKSERVRIVWKEILGVSLTEYVARRKNAGVERWELVFNEAIKTHPELTYEQRRRLKIGVVSRFAEISQYRRFLDMEEKCKAR